MIEERGGWFVRNVEDAQWYGHPAFGRLCDFQNPEQRFAEIGVNLRVLEPGKPACRYHRESVQEDFLVLSGKCRLLVNGEERKLRAWDFVHCPAGVSHVFVGDGDGPCVVLMIGRRAPDQQLFYPSSDIARPYGAEAPEPTSDPKVAYSDVPRWKPTEAPRWPLERI